MKNIFLHTFRNKKNNRVWEFSPYRIGKKAIVVGVGSHEHEQEY